MASRVLPGHLAVAASLSAVALIAALCSPPAVAEASRQIPQEPEAYAKFLERPERVSGLQVQKVVEALGLASGDKVADVGAGSGLFSRPIAQAVGPTGVAYAVDINPALLDIVARSAARDGLKNIVTVKADSDDPNIPEPVDLVFICDTMHHLPAQGAYVKRLRRYLKPGGRVAVIDFQDAWPAGHESLAFTTDELDRWMRDAGFRRTGAHEFVRNSFFFIYGQ